MRPRDDDPPRRIVHIGPGDDADTPTWDDDDRPSFLIEDARRRIHAEQSADKERSALANRLLIAFVAVVLLAVVFHIVMPAFKLHLPPIVPILSYAAIAAGAILTARDTPEDRPDR